MNARIERLLYGSQSPDMVQLVGSCSFRFFFLVIKKRRTKPNIESNKKKVKIIHAKTMSTLTLFVSKVFALFPIPENYRLSIASFCVRLLLLLFLYHWCNGNVWGFSFCVLLFIKISFNSRRIPQNCLFFVQFWKR